LTRRSQNGVRIKYCSITTQPQDLVDAGADATFELGRLIA